MSRIAAGATFGGVVGGLSAERVAAMTDGRTMLLLLAGLKAAEWLLRRRWGTI